MTLLQIDKIARNFGGLKAVDQVSFDIESGTIMGLLGPNGSGKTTLLNLISGFLSPSAGRIVFNGRDLAGARPDKIARAGIARTFQLVRILPSLTLLENVMLPAVFGHRSHWGKDADRVARAALDKTGLGDRAAASAGDLNYIDQKRLELARALAAEPELLLLDEWLAGLNPTELQEGIGLIRSLSGSGISIIMVEHIMDAVRALCPRCAVMNAGKLIADGETAGVLSDKAVIAAYLGDTADA
ncbi:ABC transporter ATP-binding protein [Hoeflea ulvae]|uniref:ABC transporter ATP-binding protein n=1 Tax=Hoeflea ulvae TaxID=2983764 RepID=A0ABT3YMD5_9HYPH|nr:ABC transporter ATP-binding protein [Hoeflea ulvae]MCY0097055.1 ABC transporter ATP-binding protein [Hoeflea ulvae]